MSLALVVALLASPAEPSLAQRFTYMIKVTNPVRVADELVERTEKLGGYFSQRTDTTIVLRVPTRDVGQLTPFLQASGIVVTAEQQASDVGPELMRQRTLLESRKSVLERYYEVLSSANVNAVVTVEQEINALVQAIESLEGSLRLLEQQLQLAEVRVDFRFPDRRPPVRGGASSFPWLNRVDLLGLLGAFANAPR